MKFFVKLVTYNNNYVKRSVIIAIKESTFARGGHYLEDVYVDLVGRLFKNCSKSWIFYYAN